VTFEPNTIVLGDCMELMPALPDQAFPCVLTDIPYGAVNNMSEERVCYSNAIRPGMFKGAADVTTFALDDFLPEITRVAAGGVFIFCSIEQSATIFGYYRDHPDFMVRNCVWTKANPSPVMGQYTFLSTVEMCVFAKRRETPFHYSCAPAAWSHPVARSQRHPTQKPVGLFRYLLESVTEPGDTVFDPCIGSGTTAVAALMAGRKYFGYELNPEYHQIALERVAAQGEDLFALAGVPENPSARLEPLGVLS